MKTRFKPKYNIRKGDQVVVISGDDKDLKKPRLVKDVLVEEGKVLVEGVNIITKHTKPSAQNTKGGIIKKEAPIHISNVAIVCKNCKQHTRIGNQILADGRRARACKKCGNVIE